MDKVIVTVAPTSNFHGKDANPALPYTPQEAADAVYEAWNEGASIVHLHGRDSNGLPTNDPGWFQEADRLIREKKCDIIIQHSMAPANPIVLGHDAVDIDDGLRTSTTTPPPEMVSLEISPLILVWKKKTIPTPWNRFWAENVARGLLEKGIKPEVEIANNAWVDDLFHLIEKEVVRKPYWVSFLTNAHRNQSGATRYSPKHVMHLVDILPPGSVFSVLGIGYPTQFEATTLSLLLGGHVRVGFEDNIFIEEGKLARNNAQLVAKTVHIATAIGREIASPSEAREMMGIPPLRIS